MEKFKIKPIIPVYLDGRYGPHLLIPIENKWEDEDSNKQEFILPETYYRAIGDDFRFPEIIDPSGGPYMPIGYEFKDLCSENKYKIDKFDCNGKYPILICSKLSS